MDTRVNPDILSRVVDNAAEGHFEVSRRVFADEEIFQREITHIFESGWVFLAHESQIPDPHDYFVTDIGSQPVVLMRDGEGQINTFYNACSHRGAQLTTSKHGNKPRHMCIYHGWVYSSAGKCAVDQIDAGDYPDYFHELDHNLRKIAHTDTYRGFIFGSLNANVQTLDDHLGDARAFIDIYVDSSPDGLEVLKGGHFYSCKANWKIQFENIDGYHFFPTHASYVGVMLERMKGSSNNDLKMVDVTKLNDIPSGSFDLGNGHIVDWAEPPNMGDRPMAFSRDEIVERKGENIARWAADRIRNLVIYPNLLLMDNASSTLRKIIPKAAGFTRLETYLIAPKNEDPRGRQLRLRQYEDFLGPCGQATPDDQSVMEACQRGFMASDLEWQQGYSRGAKGWKQGGNEESEALGIDPLYSSLQQNETFCHGMYRQWLKMMV
ncbi:MAG: Rieske 2Fe-2S domain-containing protein [Immundisolibacteraceae bacterium]|nr:Rieske 2Fe-2S domain-containing protein [Immundisolibacteraceae bacterium]